MDYLLSNIKVYDAFAARLPSTFPIETLPLWLFKEKVVLDYGCGTGRSIKYLTELDLVELWICDASRRMLEMASPCKEVTNTVWITDPRNPELPHNKFDGLLLIGVLSSIVPSKDRCLLINRLAKLLNPDAIMIFGEFGRGASDLYENRYGNAEIEPFTFQTEDGLYVHHFDAGELRDLLTPLFELFYERTVPTKTSHNRELPGLVLAARLR